MADFTLKEGDTSPAIKYQLQDAAGNAVDLSGTDVRFLMRQSRSSTLKVDEDETGNVTVTDAANGTVKYDWKAADTSSGGTFQAEWEVTYSDGTVETFPNEGFITIQINPDLD